LITIVGTLLHELHIHAHQPFNELSLTVPVIIGMSYIYLGTSLLRLKYNAWLTTVALSGINLTLTLVAIASRHGTTMHGLEAGTHLALVLLLLSLLVASRAEFRVRSDGVGFRQAVRVSLLVFVVALVYGVVGFTMLDEHDFHQEISLGTAVHQTFDQFGVTTPTVVGQTRRARLFTDSLSMVSAGAAVYVGLAFFQPIRFRLRPQRHLHHHAAELLARYPSDIDDFFKLWPHDKHYFFDTLANAGLAYHVTRGVALVAGGPFGDSARFAALLSAFRDYCFVNDWRPAFIHVSRQYADTYASIGLQLQKIGEEAVLDIAEFTERRNTKYFRQIRNRFTKLGYTVSITQPPHSAQLLGELATISSRWRQRPGRAERGFMMGYHTDEYMQLCVLAVLRDASGVTRGFCNVVPTFEPTHANYDLLRCDADTPGNSNDFLLLGLIEYLHDAGYTALNLGLCPLRGLASEVSPTAVDTALRLLYTNGDRLYSFAGLERFKAKYHPSWNDRFVAYSGGPASFVRVMSALTRAMKIK
jgi:phosphatidylglycerol lysyltransferase